MAPSQFKSEMYSYAETHTHTKGSWGEGGLSAQSSSSEVLLRQLRSPEGIFGHIKTRSIGTLELRWQQLGKVDARASGSPVARQPRPCPRTEAQNGNSYLSGNGGSSRTAPRMVPGPRTQACLCAGHEPPPGEDPFSCSLKLCCR